jgi:hypothetical protein
MGFYYGALPQTPLVFYYGALPHTPSVFPLWGAAPYPALFFEKKRGKKLLMSMPFSANTAPDGLFCENVEYFN